MSRLFEIGNHILLINRKKHHYLITLNLKEDAEFHSHAGFVPHNTIISSTEGPCLAQPFGLCQPTAGA